MIRFLLGAVVGFAACWLWDNRETLGFVVKHRDQLSAGARLYDDLKGVLGQ